jgi:hypothetical protein
MTDLRATRPWWNRRDFLKSSAPMAASVYGMRWGPANAAELPLEFGVFVACVDLADRLEQYAARNADALRRLSDPVERSRILSSYGV